MRARICINSRDKIYKLTWVNEDAKGVYIGYYGEMGEIHISYHKDGMRHIRDNNERKPLMPQKVKPIDEIDSYMLIAYQSSAIDEESMNLLATPYSSPFSLNNFHSSMSRRIFSHRSASVNPRSEHKPPRTISPSSNTKSVRVFTNASAIVDFPEPDNPVNQIV